MGNNNNLFEKIAKLSPLFIAGATFWGFLLTYLNEVGIIKYYKISTRFIQLDIHIFAMSWRGFVVLLIIGISCLLFYILLKMVNNNNPDDKQILRNIIKWRFSPFVFLNKHKPDCDNLLKYLILLPSIYMLLYIMGFLYLVLWIDVFYFCVILFIIIFWILLFYLTYIFWASYNSKYKVLKFLYVSLIIITVFIGGTETSYLKGLNLLEMVVP